MKRLFFSLICMLSFMNLFAQLDIWSDYEPTTPSRSTTNSYSDILSDYEPATSLFGNKNNENTRSQKTQENIVRTNGYYLNNGRFVRVTIKVNVTSEVGREQLYLRGIYNNVSGVWSDCNSRASRVTNMDSQTIRENFNWKVYQMSFGTIYLAY